MIKPVLTRFGTKTRMIKNIIKIMPEHKVYVEPFGGVALVLLNKPKSKREIYNDIDCHLVNFFRVLREKEKREKLKDMLNYTPYSREIFYEARDVLEKKLYKDEIWHAYYYFILCNQGFRGKVNGDSWGMSTKCRPFRNEERVFRNKIDLIDVVAERLKYVVIEKKDYKEILKIYDKDDVLFYLDPPYYVDSEYYTYKDKYYESDFNENEHRKMIDLLLDLEGKVILSGYKNKLYEKLENNDWKRLDFQIKKNPSQEKEKSLIHESLWINFSGNNHGWW